MPRNADAPAVVIFPPLLLGGSMLLGAFLDWLYPLPVLPTMPARIAGVTLIVLSAALGFRAHAAFDRVGTNISPHQPTLAIATDGPYRRTRNPLYVAGLGVYLGVACLVNGLAPLLLFVPVAGVLHWGVVLREERYLTAKFGEPYRQYLARVRRWL